MPNPLLHFVARSPYGSASAVASAGSAEAKEEAEGADAKAATKVEELEAQVSAAKAELQAKLDAASSAREVAGEAEKMQVAAAEAAREAARDLEPVSVFISRKTQRLYVRQAFQPILESPVTIRDADRPIGTYVFTALERIGDCDMRWSVVSLESGHPSGRGPWNISPLCRAFQRLFQIAWSPVLYRSALV
jgi:hypothetical protein